MSVYVPYSYHDGNVMAVRQGQRAIHIEDVVLGSQETLQVLWMGGHLLRHRVQAPPAGQSLNTQQRSTVFLRVHHHLS